MKKRINRIKKILKETILARNFLIIFSVLGIFYNLFFMNSVSDIYFLFFFIACWGAIHQFKNSGKIAITLTIAFLIICPFLILFETGLLVHKVSGWAFAFLAVGVFEYLLNLRQQ